MKRRIIIVIASVCGLSLAPSRARADVPADAIALFEQGIKDLAAGNTELACRELSASLAKYPDSGTKGALAECYTRLGKVASAWKLWKDLADTAPPELRADAASNAAQLEPRLPRYVIKLVAAPPRELLMHVNDVKVADPTLALPLPIDPGPVVVVASAPEHRPWSQTVQATEGKVTIIEVPALQPMPPAEKPVAPPASGAALGATQSQRIEGDNAGRRTRHLIGGSIALAGVAAIGIGAYLGVSANGHWQDAKDTCGGAIDNCDALDMAQDSVDSARSAAKLSTVMFVAGGVAVAAGAVVWFTAPSAERRVALSPSFDGRSTGLALSGRF